MMTGFGMGLGGIGLILMLLFWGVLIVGGVLLVRVILSTTQQNNSGSRPNENPSALEILDQRYAHGEINREEYESIKADLTDS